MMTEIPIPKFDQADAIAVLSNYRTPRFPKEREFALIGLISWMSFPNKPDFVSTALVLGAANYYLKLGSAQRKLLTNKSPFFSQRLFAETLLTTPLGGKLSLEIECIYNESENIFELIQFFMICPIERKPSLLKAFHFIEHGGFVSRDVPKEKVADFKRSAATLKKSWVNYVVASPFIWAARSLNINSMMTLAADQPKAIKKIERLLVQRENLMVFLGTAKFCQERLVSRLDKKSKSRFKFVKFPPNIPSVEWDIPSLDEGELAILAKYRPPKQIS